MFSRLHKSVLAVLLTSLSYVAAAGGHQLELYTVNFPPYTIIEPQNTIRGIDVEVVTAAFAAVGIEAIITEAPWKRILKNMEHGRVAGTLSCARNAPREKFMLFSEPISENIWGAVTSRDFDSHNLSHLSDIQGYEVIAVADWGQSQQLSQHNLRHSVTPDIDSGIRSVVYRNVDLFYNGKLPSLYHAQNLGLQDKIAFHRFEDIESTPLHLCLSRLYPDSQTLLEQFNSGLNKIKHSGEFDAIYKKYN
ncbi:amino acid ABC transporter substrate-binding protein, PAAT family [Amphritea atlantica]|uniref:Amino acid ABC transporter substrate-binding protein, PAAT family n=1 Tax=Amphritea atlantica TaxID=355243 RepID=A0A1H9KZ56_9GAMM|nr:transporter substrate-binding domain-containing protein [Amphritea atlantica]SER04474.1 amino acid ABC transporter substrate-binding protein, PAAT family [Amphritea atlantica]